jgi:endogenous inhibitor of DNA gyrase (YacG/DUF329 family)
MIDLSRWLDGSYVIASDEAPDDEAGPDLDESGEYRKH